MKELIEALKKAERKARKELGMPIILVGGEDLTDHCKNVELPIHQEYSVMWTPEAVFWWNRSTEK